MTKGREKTVNPAGEVIGCPTPMGKISEESIKRVLGATDIVDLINSYIPLKKAGASWKGVCPFHNDTHPSMTVSPVRQSFMCFACQTGGDALSFVMKYENLPFADAVRKLAERAGIPLIEEQSSPEEERRRKQRTGLLEVNRMAMEYFHNLLMKSKTADHAREYMKSRGFGSDMAARWKVGWAPDQSSSFLRWAQSKNIPARYLIDSGLASIGERNDMYCRFRDRLMFPICNDRGECVAFSGRVLGQAVNTGKYVNSPETQLFRKRDILFGLDRAKKSFDKMGRVVLCEGQLDVIACHEAGQTCVVAPLGTAFTNDHVPLLLRYRPKKVLLCFDADRAGMSAADKAFRILAPAGLDVELVDLPAGDDPDSFIKREGAEAFAALLDGARPFFEARVNRARSQGLLNDSSSRMAFSRDMISLMGCIKDAVARDLAASDMATRMRMGFEETKREVQKAVRSFRYEQASNSSRNEKENARDEERIEPIRVDRSVVVLCEMALNDAKAQSYLVERIEDIWEAMNWVPGGEVLRKILNKAPCPEDPAAIQAFIHSLPPEESAALLQMNMNTPPMSDPERAAAEACSGLIRISLERQKDAVLAELQDENLPVEKRMELIQKSIDLKNLLFSIFTHTP